MLPTLTVFGVRTAATKATIEAQISTLYPTTEGAGPAAASTISGGSASAGGASEHDKARVSISAAVVKAGSQAPTAEKDVDPNAERPVGHSTHNLFVKGTVLTNIGLWQSLSLPPPFFVLIIY